VRVPAWAPVWPQGFHRRASVIGKTTMGYGHKGGAGLVTYDDAFIAERSRTTSRT
jgi:hypothetical protein